MSVSDHCFPVPGWEAQLWDASSLSSLLVLVPQAVQESVGLHHVVIDGTQNGMQLVLGHVRGKVLVHEFADAGGPLGVQTLFPSYFLHVELPWISWESDVLDDTDLIIDGLSPD